MAWNDGLTPQTPAYGIAASAHPRIRILAGPGTGKSFAMKRRVARLIEVDGIAAASILPVTFTRVAAEDLHRELVSLAVEGAGDINGRTLHSLAMAILMRNHVLQAIGRSPRPLNEFEIEPLLSDLSSDHGDKRARRRMIQAYVAGWSRLQHEQPGYAATAQDQAFAHDLVDWLVLHEAMHIGEVIPHLYQYLRANPGAPERTEFSHVLVDEYQDWNRVEQEVVALLGDAGHICIVGDDDQSIYSFKHAHPAGIREWSLSNAAQDHQIADCQRCPTTIVRMANALISQNQNRQPRALIEKAANGPGSVVMRQYDTADQEAAAVTTKIVQLVSSGVSPGDIIVLAQRATLGTPIYRLLRASGVPAKSYYAESELDSDAAQERFALLKLFLSNEDRVALRWLLGCKHAQWHTAGYKRIMDHVRRSGMSSWDTLCALQAGELHIAYTGPLAARFTELRAELAALGAVSSLQDFVSLWLPDNPDTELLADRVQLTMANCETVSQLYSELYNAITQPEVPLEVVEVRVMSLHKSKGLSSPYVFIVGCVEGLLPGQPDMGLPQAERLAKLEEDRRLFYVGITRVKANPATGRPGYLALTSPRTMPMADALKSQIKPVAVAFGTAHLQASRFLNELGPSAPASQHNMPL